MNGIGTHGFARQISGKPRFTGAHEWQGEPEDRPGVPGDFGKGSTVCVLTLYFIQDHG
jgi:hypothetical protein